MTLARNQFIACRLPSDLKERVEDYAKKNDLTVSQVIRRELMRITEVLECGHPKQWLIR